MSIPESLDLKNPKCSNANLPIIAFQTPAGTYYNTSVSILLIKLVTLKLSII